MMDRKALEGAALRHWHMRGFLLVPCGAMGIAAGLANLGRIPSSVFLVAVVVSGSLYLWLARGYARNFGRVSLSLSTRTRSLLPTFAGLVFVVAGIQADWSLDVPINATAVGLALAVLVSYRVTVGLRRHHWYIWGATILAGLAPAWGDVGRDETINWGMIIVGIMLCVQGLFDHISLARSFPADDRLGEGEVSA